MKVLKIDDFADGDFPFFLSEPAQQNLCPAHAHDFTELVIVRGGRGVNVVDGTDYPIAAGDVFVLKKDLNHAYRDTRELIISSLLIDLDNLELPFSHLRQLPGYYALFEIEPELRRKHAFKSRLTISAEQLAVVNGMLRRIRGELEEKEIGYQAAIVGVLTELMVYVSRKFSSNADSKETLMVAHLSRAILKIETDFARDLSLDELAALANMPTRSFLRHFSSIFKVSPIKYLLDVRIQKAEEMLLNSNKSMAEIARGTGFVDRNYFSRIFKKKKGVSPNNFRKNSL